MERKILKIAIVAVLLVCVFSTLVNALSFTVTMTPSSKTIPTSTEFTVEVKVSNLDVGTNGINTLSGYLSYDDDVFEPINESSIEGRNGWSHSLNTENDNKVTLTKTSFVKTEEEVFQITFKTKSEEDKKADKGLIQFKGIKASNSASEISASDISIEIKIGQEDSNEGNTTNSGSIQATPVTNNTNTNTNKTTIGISTNTNKNTTNTNTNTNKTTNTNTNKVTPYVNSTNTTEESIPHTGVEDTIMYFIVAIVAIAIVFYIKFERINKEMK